MIAQTTIQPDPVTDETATEFHWLLVELITEMITPKTFDTP